MANSDYSFDPKEFKDIHKDQFPKDYDLEDVFDNQIHPLLKSITNICNEYGLPMVASIQYKNSPTEVMVFSTLVFPVNRTDGKLINAAKILFD